MNNNLIVLLVLPFFISCQHTNKIKKTEKTETSKRNIASMASENLSHSVTNKADLTMVVVRNNKLICALPVNKNSNLVPYSLKHSNRPPGKVQTNNLPRCNQKDINAAHTIAQNSVPLDKHGGYQVAGLPVAAGAVCLTGVALGALIANYKNKRLIGITSDLKIPRLSQETLDDQQRFNQRVEDTAMAGGVATVSLLAMVASLNEGVSVAAKTLSKGLMGAGIAGVCSSSTEVLVYLYDSIRNKF